MALLGTQTDPSTFVAYTHAAAGHDGVRSDPSGSIIVKPCTPAEVAFYESAATHPKLQAYMPTFMGTLVLSENQDPCSPTAPATAAPAVISNDLQKGDAADWVPSGGKKIDTGLSIVLENVTAGFKRPNVIDLKLGARLWNDDAPETKKRKLDELSDATTSRSLGFRIAGMRVYRPERREKIEGISEKHIAVQEDGYLSYDKYYGRIFGAENVHEAFVEFLGGEETLKKPGGTQHVAKRLAREVRGLTAVLQEEESRMYSASILMVYEGDEAAMEAAMQDEKRRAAIVASGSSDRIEEDEVSEEEEDEQLPKVSQMRLIDFAHAHWASGQGPDENALQGLRSVLKILEQLTTGEKG
ncbi:hypothetical protein GJ744_006139 [Endocarpon pusillum]|uniref:Kinase n=1 Tax=Endocarpon pusillum TaxID=364733 RepID=A0A8H7A4A5_9EURO|nr:hypothetical protein GJ744_006139 [Endocarpon pusillum]